ncbi:MAG: TIGR00299 family protein [Thermodesulfovibrio sp.]|nr:TIGR00299 family protein [Thermodesulfovibrio sp.]
MQYPVPHRFLLKVGSSNLASSSRSCPHPTARPIIPVQASFAQQAFLFYFYPAVIYNIPMKIAYFDCFSGISGDMCLGALVDAGLPLAVLEKELRKIPLRGYTLASHKVKRSGLAATKVDVPIDKKYTGEMKWNDIQKIIRESSLSPSIKKKGLSVFRALFEAESEVHGEPVNKIHLHELGAVDCIVDIFGTLIGLEMLGIEEVYASAINLGSGTIKTSHGILPVPAPAAAALLRGVPVYSAGDAFEKTTPTGAALITFLSQGYGDMPVFIPEKTGMGAGGKDPASAPNVLRILIGETIRSTAQDNIMTIETNIDDMNPQIYEYVSERLFKAGALDVFLTQIIMKKMRPAVKLSVLCSKKIMTEVIDIILSETTSIGVRYYETSRTILERRIGKIDTGYGKVRVKISEYGKQPLTITPEYEDCRELALKKGIPLSEVIEAARTAARKQR